MGARQILLVERRGNRQFFNNLSNEQERALWELRQQLQSLSGYYLNGCSSRHLRQDNDLDRLSYRPAA